MKVYYYAFNGYKVTPEGQCYRELTGVWAWEHDLKTMNDSISEASLDERSR